MKPCGFPFLPAKPFYQRTIVTLERKKNGYWLRLDRGQMHRARSIYTSNMSTNNNDAVSTEETADASACSLARLAKVTIHFRTGL